MAGRNDNGEKWWQTPDTLGSRVPKPQAVSIQTQKVQVLVPSRIGGIPGPCCQEGRYSDIKEKNWGNLKGECSHQPERIEISP